MGLPREYELKRSPPANDAAQPLEVVIGFYELWRTRLHNSALAAALGGSDAGIRHIHRKIFLPTYGVFDEERFVEPGRSVEAYDARFGRAAVIVCEDAWHSLVPTIAALDGAQVLVVTHSPQVAARAEAHWRIAKAGDAERLRTAVEVLSPADREEEIARMLAGAQITDAARAAARALMDA